MQSPNTGPGGKDFGGRSKKPEGFWSYCTYSSRIASRWTPKKHWFNARGKGSVCGKWPILSVVCEEYDLEDGRQVQCKACLAAKARDLVGK